MVRLLDLFSGIGGFALAAQRVWGDDLEIVSFCEKDEYCRKVLKKHWPDVPIVEDIRDVGNVSNAKQPRLEGRTAQQCDGHSTQRNSMGARPCAVCETRKGGDAKEAIGRIDIITGGFPCQPFSQAGKRDGRSDDRHLWPEMLRIIQLFKPTWVVAENVRGILSIEDGLVFEQVCLDLEGAGYDVQPFVIPAVAVDANHRRDRVWFVAHAINGRPQIRWPEGNEGVGGCREEGQTASDNIPEAKESNKNVAHSNDSGSQGYGRPDECGRELPAGASREAEQTRWLPEPDVGRVAHGVPRRVDRLKSLGNAIVPQVAEQLFRAIKQERQ